MILLLSRFVLIIILAGNSFRDVRKHEISVPLALTGIPAGLIYAAYGRKDLPCGMLLSILPGIVSFALTLLTRGGIGAGDGLILCILGIYYLLRDMVVILSVALGLSAVYGSVLFLRHHRGGEAYAFVPFLMAGVAAVELII